MVVHAASEGLNQTPNSATLPPPMPTCKGCGEDVDALVAVKVQGKTKKLCEDCADRAREEGEIAEASESVVQNMMEFKGKR